MRPTAMTSVAFAAACAAAIALSGCTGGTAGPTATSTIHDTVAVAAAECQELTAAVESVNDTYPNGVGLVVGRAPTAGQLRALQALADGIESVEPETGELVTIRRAILVASQTLIDRGTAGEPVTQADQDAFAGAFTAANAYCGPAATGGTPGGPAPSPTVTSTTSTPATPGTPATPATPATPVTPATPAVTISP